MKKGIDENGRVFYSIKSSGKIYKYYEDEGVIPSDVWTEFSHLQQKDPERLGCRTDYHRQGRGGAAHKRGEQEAHRRQTESHLHFPSPLAVDFSIVSAR